MNIIHINFSRKIFLSLFAGSCFAIQLLLFELDIRFFDFELGKNKQIGKNSWHCSALHIVGCSVTLRQRACGRRHQNYTLSIHENFIDVSQKRNLTYNLKLEAVLLGGYVILSEFTRTRICLCERYYRSYLFF